MVICNTLTSNGATIVDHRDATASHSAFINNSSAGGRVIHNMAANSTIIGNNSSRRVRGFVDDFEGDILG